ncbi:AraC family transcriptional activator of pobA [Endobacter medicaginis]|uniref:AraC family transcriptional activator of pobA n=1 Tax=Endobacter medicaginis TaxID=1181271 RepID=A0A839UYZ6_9PROT|nr:helix-turn-helix domain-containing protein [Endobacter medicaginis]MBB3175016.1 AraC family transcriptional activator of pobA [Endobacter medicaginis]MCX5475938.1 helix-turn-helix domain-containing protein [Endobacter medicaginis]NVN28866.1 helix-turn-helix domain-containing protein [Endobacter medicaginis]
MNGDGALPLFYLYGEPHRAVHGDFVHIESLDDRSRPSEWTIHRHTHADLSHIFHIAQGGGVLHAESDTITLAAPALIVVPAATAHGFEWQRESTGAVITLSTAHFRQMILHDSELRGLFDDVAVIAVDDALAARLAHRIGDLLAEYAWAKPGHRAAIEAGLLDLMVIALRGLDPDARRDRPAVGPQQALVARLRARIEERYRLRETVDAYADALSVSVYQLRSACLAVAGAPPSALIDQRTLLEARRALLYSNLSVKAVAYGLGFSDPAYFSRFFTQHVGRSPRLFRTQGAAA